MLCVPPSPKGAGNNHAPLISVSKEMAFEGNEKRVIGQGRLEALHAMLTDLEKRYPA
jgi:hypothetical protein